MITRLGMAAFAATAVVSALVAAPAVTATSTSSPVTTGDCAVPYPVDEVASGDLVTGLTVSRGTTPEGFTGEVLGVVTGGVAPGIDMVMVRLTSSEIDRVGGIWQGMSGSPVYAEDGRLVGAVAYGLAFGPSPVAGVTPFENMDDYAVAPARVDIGAKASRLIAAATDVTAAQAAQGFVQLPVPGGVSGVGARRMATTHGRPYLDRHAAVWGPSVSTVAGPETLVAGGNVALTVSYGDILMGSVGTVTSTCGQRVIAFGHRITFRGEIAAALNPADAVYIQEDPVSAPFKVANPGLPAGTFTDDHLTGLTGTVGVLPHFFDVTSTVTYDGRARTGTSHVSDPTQAPAATYYAIVSNHDLVMDHYGPGTEDTSWTVAGRRPNGKPFTLTLGQQYLSDEDITYEASWNIPDLVWFLTRLPGVTLDSLTTTAHVSDDTSVWKLTGVEFRAGGTWRTVGQDEAVPAKAGRELKLRAILKSGSATRRTPLSILLPARLAGTTGAVTLSSGQEGGYPNFEEAGSVSEMLAMAKGAVRTDQVMALVFDRKGGGFRQTVVSAPLDKQVTWEIYYPLDIR